MTAARPMVMCSKIVISYITQQSVGQSQVITVCETTKCDGLVDWRSSDQLKSVEWDGLWTLET